MQEFTLALHNMRRCNIFTTVFSGSRAVFVFLPYPNRWWKDSIWVNCTHLLSTEAYVLRVKNRARQGNPLCCALSPLFLRFVLCAAVFPGNIYKITFIYGISVQYLVCGTTYNMLILIKDYQVREGVMPTGRTQTWNSSLTNVLETDGSINACERPREDLLNMATTLRYR